MIRVVTAIERALPAGRWLRSGIAVGICVLAGWLTAVTMPRGPVTPTQVVLAMAVGLLVGGATGLLLLTRWAILLAPVLFAIACELGRLSAVGPTVDRPDLSTTFGILVLVLGRGFHGVVELLPMMIGTAVGAGLARAARDSEPAGPTESVAPGRHRAALWTRRGITAGLIVTLAVLAVVLTRPGTTAPIVDAAGSPVPGSVAELARVPVGGHQQTVLLRGSDSTAPVLLYLAGGPGQSDLGYTRAYMTELEQDFVFAVWDQRGSGSSYAAIDPVETLTLEQAVSDTVELTNYLRTRFDQQKIYLMGSSWGTTLGVLAVQQHPELYHAWIGTGQMVSQLASDRIIYQQVVDLAARTNDVALAERMRDYGPPPYRDMYAYAFLIGYYDKIEPYARTGYFITEGPAGIDGTGEPEYGPLDKINKEKAIIDLASVLYPQLQDLDFRSRVTSLAVPVYLVAGAHELSARTVPAREWFDQLQAPVKRWITFADSGHIPQFEQFPQFRGVLADIVAQTS